MNQNEVGGTYVPSNEENAANSKLSMFSEFGPNWVEVLLPLHTVSEANGGPKKTFRRQGKTYHKGEHWTDKHKRHKKQKAAVFMFLRRYAGKIKLPCNITLTRYAPNKLDRFDNLPMSLKWILDACCAVITGDYRPGRADDNEQIEVRYKQLTSPDYWVRIRIDF